MKSKTIATWLNVLSIILLSIGIITALCFMTIKFPHYPGMEQLEWARWIIICFVFLFSVIVFFVLQALQRLVSLVRYTLVEQNIQITRTLTNLDYDITGLISDMDEQKKS